MPQLPVWTQLVALCWSGSGVPPWRAILAGMLDDMLGRRAFLGASGGALAALWFGSDPMKLRASLAHAVRAQRRQEDAFQVLTTEQAADVDAIAAQIVPTDDLPGAREAGVVYFVDHSLATWAADQRTPF